MNRRKATVIAAAASFLLLIAGITGGGFGNAFALGNRTEQPISTVAGNQPLAGAPGDSAQALSTANSTDPRSRNLRSRRESDDDDDAGSGRRSGQSSERNRAEPHERELGDRR